MRRLLIISIVFNTALAISALATVISIPNDYVSIQAGINASANGDTVLVQPGTYVENIYLEDHAVVLASLFLTTGDTSYISQTIIDGNASGSVVTFHYQHLYTEGNSTLTGFTLQNGKGQYGGGISCRVSHPIISNNHIINNISQDDGGGIFLWTGSDPVISDNYITNNTAAERGGGIFICWSHGTISNNTICNNRALSGAGIFVTESDQAPISEFSGNLIISNEASQNCGGLYIRRSKVSLSDMIISRNKSFFNCGGMYIEESKFSMSNILVAKNEASGNCGGLYAERSVITISNSTIANNDAGSQYGSGLLLKNCPNDTIDGYVSIINTIIWNNSLSDTGIVSRQCSTYYCDTENARPGVGNISDDPLFCWPEISDYHLAENSPCVGTGEDGANIGAFGIGCATIDIPENTSNLPSTFSLFQNYPNPFNASTSISYTLPYDTNVKLDIYDVAGRHIETLSDLYQSVGSHQVTWNAQDYPSGAYFYKIQAGDFTETKMMLLIK